MVKIMVPSGKLTSLWKITIFNGKTHCKKPFSIAMLVYQRVNPWEKSPHKSTGES